MSHKHSSPKSSSISECTYDPATKDMHITFVSGGRHCFKDVEPDDFHGFRSCESVGKYYHSAIRGKYKGEKVE